jgi:hypothetical protein
MSRDNFVSKTTSPVEAVCRSNPTAPTTFTLPDEKTEKLKRLKRHLEQFRQLGIIQLSEEQLDEILCAVDSHLSAEYEDLCRSGCHGTPARMPYPLLLETFGKTDASEALLNRTFGLVQAGSSLLLVIPSAVLMGSSLVMPLAGATGGGLFYLTLDNWNAGVQAVLSGEHVETWTQQGATHLAQMVVEPEIAQWVGVGVDVAANLGGGLFAIRQAGRINTIKSSPVSLKEFDRNWAKLYFDSSLNVVDKSFAIKANEILIDNPIGYASYTRLQRQGTNVYFVNDPTMIEMGVFNPYKNSVIVNMFRHSSADEVASTVVHEATHQHKFFKGIRQNTQFSEYQAFRNELFFQIGIRPSLENRFNLWNDVQELYPQLNLGRYPFGTEK